MGAGPPSAQDELKAIGTMGRVTGELVEAYTTLLLSMMGMRATLPGQEQCVWLHNAIERLLHPIDAQALIAVSTMLPGWAGE